MLSGTQVRYFNPHPTAIHSPYTAKSVTFANLIWEFSRHALRIKKGNYLVIEIRKIVLKAGVKFIYRSKAFQNDYQISQRTVWGSNWKLTAIVYLSTLTTCLCLNPHVSSYMVNVHISIDEESISDWQMPPKELNKIAILRILQVG